MKRAILVIAQGYTVAVAGYYRVDVTIYRTKRVFVYFAPAAWIFMCRQAPGFSTLMVTYRNVECNP